MPRSRLLVSFCVALLMGTPSRGETNIDAQAPGASGKTPVVLAIMPMQARPGVPHWFGQLLQQDVRKDAQGIPALRVASLSSAGFTPEPDYALAGDYGQTPRGIAMKFELVSMDEQRVVARLTASGSAADLMTLKEDIRRQVKEALARLAQGVDPGKPTTRPTTMPADTVTYPDDWEDGEFENSSLRWALENPDEAARELDKRRPGEGRVPRQPYVVGRVDPGGGGGHNGSRWVLTRQWRSTPYKPSRGGF